uniref:DNA replication complex GINS protein PSF3 n=1 Tax=Salmo trutta TaxID=8032 RepID=A0A673Y0P5_SALTR
METHSYFPVPPGVGMEENFLSLDDILLSHERLPSRTECTFPRLGFLEKSSDSRDIQEGTKMEMPLFLAKGLYERKRRVVSVELPKVYKEGWRTVFNADPTVVDLHKMGPYYYGLGSQLLHFDSPENPEIAQAVLQVSTAHKHLYPLISLSHCSLHYPPLAGSSGVINFGC